MNDKFGNATGRGSATPGEPTPSAAQLISQRLDSIPPLPAHVRWAAVIAIGSFFDSFDSMILASGLPAIIPTLHIGYAKVGLVISAAFFGMLVGAVIFGALGERFGRRTTFAISIMLFGILSVLCAFSWNFTSLFWLRVLEGLGLGGTLPLCATISAECMPTKSRGKAYAFSVGLLFACGFIIAPLIGAPIVAMLKPAISWRVLFCIGGVAFPFGIASFWLLPETPRWLAAHGRLPQAEALLAKLEAQARKLGRPLLPVVASKAWQPKATKFREAFSHAYWRRTVLIWGAFFTTYVVQYGIGAWLPTLYVKIGGLPPSRAITLAMIAGCVQVAFDIVVAFSVDRIGRVSLMKLSFWIMIAGFVLGILMLSVFHASSWPVLFLTSLVLAAGVSINSGLVYLYAPELFPTRMRSLITATGSAAARIGSMLSPILIGNLLQAHLGLVSVFIALGIVCIVGLVIASIFGVETKQRSLEDISI